MIDLPTNEDGDIITSAEFGELVLVKITYNTNPDGSEWEFLPGEHDPDEDQRPNTLHGPFVDGDEAQAWMDAYPEGDTDIDDMVTITLNAVRPGGADAGA